MNQDKSIEETMKQIKENIKARTESNSSVEVKTLHKESKLGNSSDLDYINSNWDLQSVEYDISSHRPIVGRLLVWGRKLIHGELRRYTDLITKRQTEFNSHIVSLLDSYSDSFDRKINEIDTKNNIKDDKNGDTKEFVSDSVMNYFKFEDKYRGTTEEIKRRQSVFLQYFDKCKNVLDIGSGRGDFLSLLKEKGIGAKGIDINEDMVLFSKKNDLDVVQIDALSYLKSLEDKSLDGVFSGQLVEHLQPNELINMVKLCHDKMIYGTHLILETQNPLCLSIFAKGFYIDLSHVKPVHPETLKFLLESTGFRDIKFEFFSQVSVEERLDKLTMTENMSDNEKVYVDKMNKNIDKLNSLIYGCQDYAIIGKK